MYFLLARICWGATVALLPFHAWADNGQDCLPLYYMKSYKQALPSCQQAAAAGYDQAQYVLGMMYVEGLAGAKNNQQAAHWFKAAAAQGHAAARFKLNNIGHSDSEREHEQFISKLWANSLAPPDTAREPMPIEPLAAPKPIHLTQYSKPKILKDAAIAPRLSMRSAPVIVPEKAMRYPSFEGLNSAETADISKELALDMAETNGFSGQSDASIFEHYAQAAKQGDARAQLMLGLMYHEGRGVKRNDVRAVYVLQQAASQGNGQAQLSLALMLYAGNGVKKNEAQAKNWFTRAAQKGIADAQYSLGLIYATNQHFKSDAKAVRWWKKAAAQKHMLAQHNLAVMYLKGLGMKGESVEKNRSEAVYWLEEEAKHGNSMAQFNLAQLYSEGKWLHKNAELATNWFYRAGANYLALGQKDDAMKSANKIKQLSAGANKDVPNSFLADVLTRQIQESAR